MADLTLITRAGRSWFSATVSCPPTYNSNAAKVSRRVAVELVETNLETSWLVKAGIGRLLPSLPKVLRRLPRVAGLLVLSAVCRSSGSAWKRLFRVLSIILLVPPSPQGSSWNLLHN
jgi:hypothetical protein